MSLCLIINAFYPIPNGLDKSLYMVYNGGRIDKIRFSWEGGEHRRRQRKKEIEPWQS